MSGAGADFIPLSSNSDKSGKKRKHNKDHHEHRSGANKDARHHEHRSGSNKSSDRDRDPNPKSSQVKNESRCPKLRTRICKYLEENRHRVS
jgi:hypothetical protein